MKIQTHSNPSLNSAQLQHIEAPKQDQTKLVSTADTLVGKEQGAPPSIGQLGEPELLGIGRGGSHGQTGAKGKRLSATEIKLMAGIGGAGLKGRGAIEGEIEKRAGKYVLVTAAEGSKSEVRFTLDLPAKAARGLEGQRVAIEGMLEKQSPWGGKVTGAKIAPASVYVGTTQVLSGKIENRSLAGIGGEAPPSGSYLVLDRPIKVHGKSIKEVFLAGAERKDGSDARLHGRIDEGSWGGVETKGGSYIKLSGISDLAKGEPRYVDGIFYGKRGQALERMDYNRPMLFDAPSLIFVIDESKVFIGAHGGHIPPGMNAFHGFRASAKVSEASEADKKALSFDADGTPRNQAGEALTRISPEGPATPPYPDFMAQTWYYDANAKKAYRVDNGGIAGFHNRVAATFEG